MSRGWAILLILGTTAAIFAAMFAVRSRSPESLPQRQPVFPGLVEKLNDINRIEIRQQQERILIVRDGSSWRISTSGNYPANYQKVRNTLLALSLIEILEYKTENPELYPKLQVEDPESEGAQSKGLRVFIGDETTMELIIGKSREGSFGRFYARRPPNPRTLLVSGELRLGTQSRDWLETLILDVSKDRIQEITYQNPDGSPWRLYRDDPETQDFQLSPLPEDQRIRSQALLNQTAASLEQTHMENTMRADTFQFGPQTTYIHYRAFDGLHIAISAERRGNLAYAAFRASYEAPPPVAPVEEEDPEEAAAATARQEEVRAEAKRLAKSLDPWVFEIPLFKYLSFTRPPDTLTKPSEAEPPPAMETLPPPEIAPGQK